MITKVRLRSRVITVACDRVCLCAIVFSSLCEHVCLLVQMHLSSCANVVASSSDRVSRLLQIVLIAHKM